MIVVGSQALLVGREDIERSLRNSQEIDLYPANAREWEASQDNHIEASEEINAHFGVMSQFHTTFGFYIDGVDENTAKLPDDWKSRAEKLDIDLTDRTVEVIAPSPTDLVAAKLARGDPKDLRFASICMRSGLARHDQIKKALEVIMPEHLLLPALNRLRYAARSQQQMGRDKSPPIA